MGWLANLINLFADGAERKLENPEARLHARTFPNHQPIVFQIFTPDYRFKVVISKHDETTYRIKDYHWSPEEFGSSFWENGQWNTFTDDIGEAKKLALERLREISGDPLLNNPILVE